MGSRSRVGLAGLLLLLTACKGTKADPNAITVDVTKGDLIFATSFYGEIESKESHPIFVPEFRNTWQITVETVVPDGTHVKKGDVVLGFAKGTFEEDLREKVSELAVAEANERAARDRDQAVHAAVEHMARFTREQMSAQSELAGSVDVALVDFRRERHFD